MGSSGPVIPSHDGAGYQIDLVFDRQDKVKTVCEIKHLTEKAGPAVMAEMARKIERTGWSENKIQKVLIAPNGVTDRLRDTFYFDRVLSLDDLRGI